MIIEGPDILCFFFSSLPVEMYFAKPKAPTMAPAGVDCNLSAEQERAMQLYIHGAIAQGQEQMKNNMNGVYPIGNFNRAINANSPTVTSPRYQVGGMMNEHVQPNKQEHDSTDSLTSSDGGDADMSQHYRGGHYSPGLDPAGRTGSKNGEFYAPGIGNGPYATSTEQSRSGSRLSYDMVPGGSGPVDCVPMHSRGASRNREMSFPGSGSGNGRGFPGVGGNGGDHEMSGPLDGPIGGRRNSRDFQYGSGVNVGPGGAPRGNEYIASALRQQPQEADFAYPSLQGIRGDSGSGDRTSVEDNLSFGMNSNLDLRNSSFGGLRSWSNSSSSLNISGLQPQLSTANSDVILASGGESFSTNLIGSNSNFDALFKAPFPESFETASPSSGVLDPTSSLNTSMDASNVTKSNCNSILSPNDPEITNSPVLTGSPYVVSPKSLSPAQTMSPKTLGPATRKSFSVDTNKMANPPQDFVKDKIRFLLRQHENEFIDALASLLNQNGQSTDHTVGSLFETNGDSIVAAFRQISI
jgi:hypothetical protein